MDRRRSSVVGGPGVAPAGQSVISESFGGWTSGLALLRWTRRVPASIAAILLALLLSAPSPVLAQAPAGTTPAVEQRADPAATRRTDLEVYADRLEAVAATYPRLPVIVMNAFERPNGRDVPVDPWRLLTGLSVLIAAGTTALLATNRALARTRERVEAAHAAPVIAAVLRLSLGLVGVAAYVVGALIAYAALHPRHPAAPAILLAVLQASVTVLLVDRLVRFLCAPDQPALRLLPLDTTAARALHRTAMVTVTLAAGVLGLVDLLMALGVGGDAIVAIGLPASTIPFIYLLHRVWRGRNAVALALAGPLSIDPAASPALGLWPVAATVYLIGLWLVVAASAVRLEPGTGPRMLISLLAALAVPAVALIVQRPLARFYRGEETEAGKATVTRVMRAVWTALFLVGLFATAAIWGFRVEKATGFGGILLRLAVNVSVVLLLGYVAWTLVVRAIDRALEGARQDSGNSRAQRMATLLPLLRKFLQIVLITVVAMIMLSSVGIEIGPLLAGAGVVGIAIGLGAQSTIADILAGVFYLLEDAFHMGDYVEVGQLRGTVEGISLRSLKLRHHRGAVHTLPFGQIKALTNYSRDWALMRLEFRVPPDTDMAVVKKIVKTIGKELADDPEMGPSFIEGLKSQGVRRVEDDAVIIGVKFTAKPDEQFVIRREAYHRLIRAFRDNGISLVGRGVVVHVDDPSARSQAIGFAAAQALEGAMGGAKGNGGAD
ncbi:mechanosensitive ion channel domain-containing protein [Azospirillum canadense]|uniref:mechanosensitive ion channel domain-containing protein n=1 Tax=Azospirillum canadense TaxID=403962 RepID=UPI002226C64B|nr:mechanosensitive ion channel domain-containing protein [Azospirillum canadense]MCW2238370.1 small-conductance mechanosensitive channel [Azospirillum canadense]